MLILRLGLSFKVFNQQEWNYSFFKIIFCKALIITYGRTTSFQFLINYVLIQEMKDNFEKKMDVFIIFKLTHGSYFDTPHTAQYAQFNTDISVFKFVKMGP